MTLENREATQYDKMRLEKISEYEEDGIEFEVYKKLVTKNSGELQEFVEVAVPKTLEDAEALQEEDEMINFIQKGLVDQEADKHRRLMVTEEEKEERVKKTKDKLSNLVEELKAMGLSEEEIEEKLG